MYIVHPNVSFDPVYVKLNVPADLVCILVHLNLPVPPPHPLLVQPSVVPDPVCVQHNMPPDRVFVQSNVRPLTRYVYSLMYSLTQYVHAPVKEEKKCSCIA